MNLCDFCQEIIPCCHRRLFALEPLRHPEFIEHCPAFEWIGDLHGRFLFKEKVPKYGVYLDVVNEDGEPEVPACDSFKIDYAAYLSSPEWRNKKRERLQKDGFQCQICGSAKNLNVHHITYENVPWEEMDDLMTVCQSCHRKIHEKDIERKQKREQF